MSRFPGAPRGKVWTAHENELLRQLAELGYTVKQMSALSEDLFGEFISDASIRNHMNYAQIPYTHERRAATTTPEMKEWMRRHYMLPIDRLVDLFNEHFDTTYSKRAVYRLAYRVAEAEARGALSADLLTEEWRRCQLAISPNGQIKASHWLWRYYPLDENRKASGVTFRGERR